MHMQNLWIRLGDFLDAVGAYKSSGALRPLWKVHGLLKAIYIYIYIYIYTLQASFHKSFLAGL